MFKSLMHKKWLALMYVCNDLMILPDDMQLEPSVCPDEITKKVMVTALVRWVSRVQSSSKQSLTPFGSALKKLIQLHLIGPISQELLLPLPIQCHPLLRR